ncbi:unnamed protein product [Dicrocoelium dendriticum]|nr:unnamed protein product [Dicrocoelium dendriticum]
MHDLATLMLDPSHQTNAKIPEYETQEWQLARYARLLPDTPPSVTTDQSDGPDRSDDGTWEEWNGSIHGPKLLTRLAGFGHLCIMYGNEVLESYFLILAKKWMKIVLLDDEVMVLAKRLERTCRLRLSFQLKEDAEAFYCALSRFASCKELSNERTQPQMDSVEEQLNNMLSSTAAGLPPPSWTTEWPTASLEGLVRLCLQDPNFPGFVRQVDAAMKNLTNSQVPLFGPR